MIEDKLKCFCVNANPASDYVKKKSNTDYEYLCHTWKRDNCEYAKKQGEFDFCLLYKHIVIIN